MACINRYKQVTLLREIERKFANATGYAGYMRGTSDHKTMKRNRLEPTGGNYDRAQEQYIKNTYKRTTGMLDLSMDKIPKIAFKAK